MLIWCHRSIDIKYAQFGEEIRTLASSLKQLDEIVANADGQCPQGFRFVDRATVNALSQVTGDFLQTVQDCKRLLDDNSRFKRTAANCVDNVIWHASTERDVNNLRQRVLFHQTKVNFIAKPFEYQLLLGISKHTNRQYQHVNGQLSDLTRSVAEIKGILTDNTGRAPGSGSTSATEGYLPLPQDIETRFEKALFVNQPTSFKPEDDLPLTEGLNAAILHLAKSTTTFNRNPVLGQHVVDPAQFLNLLKSRWVFMRLKGGATYQKDGPESLWTTSLDELEHQIKHQLSRFETNELTAPPVDVLSQLPDSCFSIWVGDGTSPQPLPVTYGRPLEEKILELELIDQYPERQSTLTIFKKSDDAFRLVSTSKNEQNNSFDRECVDVNMAHTRLIPTYAASKDTCNTDYSFLLSQHHIQSYCYTFQDLEGAHEFQRALTGYRVSCEIPNVKWLLEHQKWCKRGMSGNATLQFWQMKPLSKKVPYSEPELELLGNHCSNDSSTTKGANSPSISTGLKRFNQSATSQPPRSANESRVSGCCGYGTALLRPEPPVLAILNECEKKYSFLHLRRMTTKACPFSLPS